MQGLDFLSYYVSMPSSLSLDYWGFDEMSNKNFFKGLNCKTYTAIPKVSVLFLDSLNMKKFWLMWLMCNVLSVSIFMFSS